MTHEYAQVQAITWCIGCVFRCHADPCVWTLAPLTCKSAFPPSYFAQILEEYGPLGAQDPLLVGELDNFPPDAQQKIQEAGGLEHFLLESLRFVMTDNLLGLMKHAVSLQDTNTHRMDNLDFIGDIPNGLSLNPSAMEFLPNSHDSGPRDYDEPFAIINVRPNPVEFTGYLEVIAKLPSPYVLPVFGAPPAPPTNEIASAIGTLRAEDMSYNNHDPRNLEAFDLYISGVDEQGLCETVYAPVLGAKAPGKTAVEVQVGDCPHSIWKFLRSPITRPNIMSRFFSFL